MGGRKGRRRGKRQSKSLRASGEGRRLWRWVGLSLLALAVALWAQFGERIKMQAGLPSAMLPDKDDAELRVVTWNLRNFPGSNQDLPRLVATLDELDADIVGVQEVKDPEALRELLPTWKLAMSKKGGRGHQRLGVLYRPGRLDLISEEEFPELSMGGRVRPAFAAYFRARPHGPDFYVVVVHLKARPDGHDLRREQWPLLQQVVERLSKSDGDVVVLGDFNVVGEPDGSARAELDDLDESMARVGLQRLPVNEGCTAYWDGARRDAWKEPSLLDLVWVAGMSESLGQNVTARAGAHCGKHACEAFRSTEAYPDLSYEGVSDHCPVAVELRAGEDDDP